jgi:hypothetical protein
MAKIRRFLSMKQSLPPKEAETLWIQAAYSDESFGMRAGVQSLLVEKTLALHAHPEINGTELLEKVRKWEVSRANECIIYRIEFLSLNSAIAQLSSQIRSPIPSQPPVYYFLSLKDPIRVPNIRPCQKDIDLSARKVLN